MVDQNKDKFTIDYDTYFEKQVISPLSEFNIESNNKVIGEYKSKYPHFYSKTVEKGVICPRCGRTHSKLQLAQKCIKKIDRQDQQLLKESIQYLKKFK